jgi:hypothetical protein
MMRLINYISLLSSICIILIINGCNKFEDGNNFSIRTVKGRLVKGSPWIFEKLEVDGVDKSAEFRADSSYFDYLNFNKVHRLVTDEFSFEEVSYNCYSTGNFELFEENKIQIFALENGCVSGEFDHYQYGPIFRDFWVVWIITRLSMDELQMKTVFGGIEYKLFLKSNRE